MLKNITICDIVLFFSGTTISVSDGSYKDDEAAAGVMMEDTLSQKRYFFIAPVPANVGVSDNDSYRSDPIFSVPLDPNCYSL